MSAERWCVTHDRAETATISGWCGYYLPELGVSEDYGCEFEAQREGVQA